MRSCCVGSSTRLAPQAADQEVSGGECVASVVQLR
jgi:hypothetical protein